MAPALPWSVRLRAVPMPLLGLLGAGATLAFVNPLVVGTPGEGVVLVALVLGIGLAAGRLAEILGLPRLTGHLLAGIALSPGATALFHLPPVFVDVAQARVLTVVNDLAVGVIALMAGSEIQGRWLRAHGQGIATITGLLLGVVPLACALVLALPLAVPSIPLLPFLAQARAEGMHLGLVIALAGVVLVANGPTVVVGVIRELGARGPLAQTLLATSVVLDGAVVVLVTVLLALLDAGEGIGAAFLGVSAGLTGSLAVGLAIGWGLRRFSDLRPQHLVWVILVAALGVATVGVHLGLKPLFCLLAAGFAFGNWRVDEAAPAQRRLHHALGQLGTPVFALFFVAAGMAVHLGPLLATWFLVLSLLIVRDATIWGATRWGAQLAGIDPAVGRSLWTGMTTQAGVTLAFASLIATHHPGWGSALASVLVALVTVHELWCPLVLARALRAAQRG